MNCWFKLILQQQLIIIKEKYNQNYTNNEDVIKFKETEISKFHWHYVGEGNPKAQGDRNIMHLSSPSYPHPLYPTTLSEEAQRTPHQ